MGHVMRCRQLAAQLKARKVAVEFATALDTPGAEWIKRDGWKVHNVPEHVAPLGLGTFDALIIDLEMGPTTQLLLDVRATFPAIINIGCIGFAPDVDPEVVDRMIDLQIYGVALFDPPRTAYELAGPPYLMIDPAFAKCQPDPAGPIVISIGGADPHGLTPAALDGVLDTGRHIRAVVGPAATFNLGPVTSQVHVIREPDSLIPVLDGASMAVTATGMTAYECLAAGVPVALTNLSLDHEKTARALEARGVARNLGLWDIFSPGLVRRALWRWTNAPDSEWKRASRNARALVDGQGTARCVEAICKLIAAR